MGVLLSAFLWTYALAQAPAGALIDRHGAAAAARRRAGAVVGGAGGDRARWRPAAADRRADGARRSARRRSARSAREVVRSWFAERRRGLATGVFNSASTLGPAIAPPIVTALMLGFGWRGAFFATGARRPRRRRALDRPLPRSAAAPRRRPPRRYGSHDLPAPAARADAVGDGGRQLRLRLHDLVLRRVAAVLPRWPSATSACRRSAGRPRCLTCSASPAALSAAGPATGWPPPAFRRSPAARRRSWLASSAARPAPASRSPRRPARGRWPRSAARSSAPTSPPQRSGRSPSPPRRPAS